MRRNAMANRRPPMAMRGAPMRRGPMRPGTMRGPAALGPRGRFSGPPPMGNGAMLRRGGAAFGGRGAAPMLRRGQPGDSGTLRGRGPAAMLRRGQPGDSAMAFRGRAGRRPLGDSLGTPRRTRRDTSAAPPLDH
jgi:hypothetical protein